MGLLVPENGFKTLLAKYSVPSSMVEVSISQGIRCLNMERGEVTVTGKPLFI